MRLAAARSSPGFTLVEVLVVVLIIGVMVTFATLSVGDRATADKLDTEAQRLEQLFRLAQEEAELKGYELGFRYTDELYQFLLIDREGRWVPVAEGPLRTRAIPQPLQLALRVEGRAVPPAQDPLPGGDEEETADAFQPQVLILSSGELTAFALDLSAPGYDVGYRVAGTLIGRISLERVERDGLG